MEREGNSDPIPIDIILDILSRSSPNTIARFGLASKFCASILKNRPSTCQPRILFAIKNSDEWRFYTSPQPQNTDENHSHVVSADFHMKLPGDMGQEICGPVSGLLYFPNTQRGKVSAICNPTTGQYSRLPQLKRKRDSRSLLGYDPIGKHYKVATIRKSIYGGFNEEEDHIVTLGSGKKISRRKLHCPLNHYPTGEGICINGVLYYIAGQAKDVKIACFDVRSEKLRFLNTISVIRKVLVSSSPTKLINYKGKFGVISWLWNSYDEAYKFPRLELCLWILEDSKKQEWLQHEYSFWMSRAFMGNLSVVGVTATGEIVLSMDYTSKPFFVFYYNPERRTLTRVIVKGFEASENSARVYTFVDYVEDLKFINRV